MLTPLTLHALITIPLLFSPPSPTYGGPGNPGETGKAETLVSALYPVADLVVPVGLPQGDQLRTTESLLMGQIRKHVSPESWEGAGGRGVLQYRSDGFSLLVRQTPRVHAELKAFLDSLQKVRDLQVSLEMRVLSVSGRWLDKVTGEMGLRWTTEEGSARAVLDDMLVYRLLDQAQECRSTHICQAPKITCFSGQLARIEIGDTMTFFTGVRVREEDGKKTLEPVVRKEFLGYRWKLLPVASADHRHTQLSFEVEITNLAGPAQTVITPLPFPAGETLPLAYHKQLRGKGHVMVEVPAAERLRFAGTERLASGRSILIRGGLGHSAPTAPTPLASLPFVGELFTGPSAERQEVAIILTPRLLTSNVEQLVVAEAPTD